VVGYYRLNELGFRLGAGYQLLTSDEVAPVAEATRLLAEAEARATTIVADAEEGYRRECERGYQDGLDRARLEAVERLLAESHALDEKLRSVERDLVGIVVSSVKRLVHDLDDSVKAEALVRSALRQMRREKRAELRVSPEQFLHFKAAMVEIGKDFPEVDLVDVVEDADLSPPQIIVETSIGRVEGDLGRNLAELEMMIRQAAAMEAEETPPHRLLEAAS
jgi:type III secretion protein L